MRWRTHETWPLFWMLLLLACFAPCGRAQTTDLPLIAAEDTVPFATGTTSGTKSYSFSLPAGSTTSNTVVTLEINARFNSNALSGSNPLLNVVMNSQAVADTKNRGLGRLQNRPLISRVSSTVMAPWYGAPSSWRVVYAPDFNTTPSFYTGDPYTSIFDITDLVNMAGGNQLDLTNTATEAIKTATGRDGGIVVRRLIIHARTVGAGESPSLFTLAPQPATTYLNAGTPGKGPAAYTGALLAGGGFSVTVGSQVWKFNSAYSFPNAGFNQLVAASTPDAGGQAGWSVTASGGSVTATGPTYRVQRAIGFTSRKVTVADTITNLTASGLGMMVRNEVSLKGKETTPVRLAGCGDSTIFNWQDTSAGGGGINNYNAPGNPTVYVESGDHGLGILAEDEVYRNQGRLYIQPDSNGSPAAGIKTEMLWLPPSGSYTLNWSVYPVQGVDYFDFINLARADWGSNITALGPWYWGFPTDTVLSMSSSQMTNFFTNNGIRYVVQGGGWVDPQVPAPTPPDLPRIGFGNGVRDSYWNSFRTRLASAVTKLQSYNLKVLLYYNSQRDTTTDTSSTPYLFPDSLRYNANGTTVNTTTWGNLYSLTYSMVPTLSNSFGSTMRNSVIPMYMNSGGTSAALNADGIYFDEMENVTYGNPTMTYHSNQADGRSCQLDPYQYTVTSANLGLTQLLAKGHRLAEVDAVKNWPGKSGIVLGNGPTYSAEMLGTGIQRMVESQHNDLWPSEGHLQTPLGYLGSGSSFQDMQRLFVFGLLPVGTYASYGNLTTGAPVGTTAIMKYLFPFTPIEIHSGYLLGQERIIVSHPGNYGWPNDQHLAQVRYFNSDGTLGSTDYNTSVTTTAAKVNVTLPTSTTLRSYSGAAVVLEKLPMTLSPASGTASVAGISYGATQVKCNIYGLNGATLRINTGVFPITPGANYTVTWYPISNPGAVTTVTLTASGSPATLEIPVAPTNNGAITLRVNPV